MSEGTEATKSERPSKIVCVGRNYRAHAAELGNEVPREPLIFLKPPSSIVHDGDSIILPSVSERVEYEGEIGIVIGERLKDATEDDALSAIAAVIALNDVTARDLQRSDGQWTRAKGFDTFCPVGSRVDPPSDLSTLTVTTNVNGEPRQSGRASDMVFPIPFLLSYISRIMTLEPGDYVATGTPSGVGPLAPGDVVEVVVGGSVVRNTVEGKRKAASGKQ